jgi:hypothetical protein
VGCFGFERHGWWGLAAAAVAGLVCFVSATASFLVTALTAGTPNALSGTLFGIFLRTMIPFLVTILLVQSVAPLAEAGLFGMVVITYLVVLAVETTLVVRVVRVVQAGLSGSMVVR